MRLCFLAKGGKAVQRFMFQSTICRWRQIMFMNKYGAKVFQHSNTIIDSHVQLMYTGLTIVYLKTIRLYSSRYAIVKMDWNESYKRNVFLGAINDHSLEIN